MCEIGCVDYDIYYDKLMFGLLGEVEWVILVDCLIVQEISFFRYLGFYELVVDYCCKFYEDEGCKDIELWSVGCVMGEEVYFLVMVLDELVFEQSCKCYYGIIVIDISLLALVKVWDGVYVVCRLEWLDKYYVD